MVEGFSLQDVIRFAARQRNLASNRGFNDVAAFWSDVLYEARSRVTVKPHSSVRMSPDGLPLI